MLAACCHPITGQMHHTREIVLIGSVTDTFQGYDADHVDIDLLRLRNYTIGKTLTDDELVETGGMDRVAELLTCMKPFVSGSFSVLLLITLVWPGFEHPTAQRRSQSVDQAGPDQADSACHISHSVVRHHRANL